MVLSGDDDVLQIWINVGQRLTILAIGVDGCSLGIFLSPIISSFSLLLGIGTARYRLKDCLKEPLNRYYPVVLI